jgi:nucleotide-binding universal stress UspA family protein
MVRILVALDESQGSEKALEAAVKLAQLDGGHVMALTVLERTGDPHLDRIAEAVSDQARRRLDELLQTAANFARSRGVRLTPILREGHAADAIVACAEAEKAEVVIVGGNGASDRAVGLGGTADLVSSHCPCSVIIVK